MTPFQQVMSLDFPRGQTPRTLLIVYEVCIYNYFVTFFWKVSYVYLMLISSAAPSAKNLFTMARNASIWHRSAPDGHIENSPC